MRVAGLLENAVVFSGAESLQHRSRAVGAKGASEELANHRDGAALLEQECWQDRRLIDPAPNANPGERHDRGGQFLRQDDRPLALVIARARWPLPREELHIGERHLTVDGLADMD